jgi:hypothetical protein
MGIKVDVYGVRETLAELKKYERETFNTISDDLKTSAMPAARAVGRHFPDEPLMNWHSSGGRLTSRSRLPPYLGSKAKGSVKVGIMTAKRKSANEHGLIRLQQMDGGGQVYDSAGSVTAGGQGSMASAGAKFISNLDKHLSTKSRKGVYRSRVMFPFTKKYLYLIEKAVETSIRKIDVEVTKKINGM